MNLSSEISLRESKSEDLASFDYLFHLSRIEVIKFSSKTSNLIFQSGNGAKKTKAVYLNKVQETELTILSLPLKSHAECSQVMVMK